MPNRLAGETSPYLLQHKDNPVDWYPWGDEAFAVATDTDRPILLSVGYSTCHWCHVMERESFEDMDTAALMNAHFVPVKVDREERPDVDAIYMEAVNVMTGRGGWPMTVFLTPAGEPFYAGTYFPDVERHGMPSFGRVLAAIHDAWTTRRTDLADQAASLTGSIGQSLPPADELPGGTNVVAAYHSIAHQFDNHHGGLGGAPKFPQEPILEFLTRVGGAPWADRATEMLTITLTNMAEGGIYDHLGGGFSRYSVDHEWLVPHFEKMLYTNADLARLYVRGWQVTGNEQFRTVAIETLDYILADLAHPAGGFYAAEDADSEGAEGTFYVFGYDEFHEVVGEVDGPIAAHYFGVTPGGNFEGLNVLHQARSIGWVADQVGQTEEFVAAAIDRAKERLLARRESRIRPGLDTKVITAWNGLALRALSVAGVVLEQPRYLTAARANASFVLDEMRIEDGRLYRTWSDGHPSIGGFLEDHSSYALGLLELFQATGEPRWFLAAREIVDLLEGHFGGEQGVVFASAADASHLVVRPADQQDNPSASGASLAAECYLLMSAFTGEGRYRDLFEQIVKAGARLIERAPFATGHLLATLATARMGMREIALTGPTADEWATRLAASYRPNVVIAAATEPAESIPLLSGRYRPNSTLAYVCEQMMCQAPVDSYADLMALL